MRFALQNRQAVVMWANTTRKNRVAVVEQVMCSNRGCRVSTRLRHILRRLFCGDVLEHDFEFREITAQRNKLLLDEHRLAIKQINLAAGDLAMHEQQDAFALHRLQGFVGLAQIGHARIAVGGRACGIELERHHASFFGALDFIGGQVVGQIQRHQRLKLHTLRHRRQNALLVGQR